MTMYCRNCGKQLPDGSRFCGECGTPMEAPAGPAPEAPAAVAPAAAPSPTPVLGIPVAEEAVSPKSRLIVTLLAALPFAMFGVGGIHRFYLGKIGTGVVQLVTFGGLIVWQFIDFIMAVSGNMKDKEGRVIRDWKVK
jgi:hypothetical protein